LNAQRRSSSARFRVPFPLTAGACGAGLVLMRAGTSGPRLLGTSPVATGLRRWGLGFLLARSPARVTAMRFVLVGAAMVFTFGLLGVPAAAARASRHSLWSRSFTRNMLAPPGAADREAPAETIGILGEAHERGSGAGTRLVVAFLPTKLRVYGGIVRTGHRIAGDAVAAAIDPKED